MVCDNKSIICKYNLEKNKEMNFNDIDLDKLKPDYFCLTSMTVKTETLRKANLYLDEKTFYVDMEYVILPINEINTLIYLDYNIYRYFFGRVDQSVNVSNYVKNRANHEKVLRRLVEFYANTEFSDNKRKYVKYIITDTLRT